MWRIGGDDVQEQLPWYKRRLPGPFRKMPPDFELSQAQYLMMESAGEIKLGASERGHLLALLDDTSSNDSHGLRRRAVPRLSGLGARFGGPGSRRWGLLPVQSRKAITRIKCSRFESVRIACPKTQSASLGAPRRYRSLDALDPVPGYFRKEALRSGSLERGLDVEAGMMAMCPSSAALAVAARRK
jgi:hypothetical protein